MTRWELGLLHLGSVCGTVFQHFPEAAGGGVGCLREVVSSRHWKGSYELEWSCVKGVDACVGGAGPFLQFNFASLCTFYKLVEPGSQVGAYSSMVTFTGHLASPQSPPFLVIPGECLTF